MQDSVKFFSLNKRMDWEKGCSVNFHVFNDGLTMNQMEKYGVYRIVRPDELDGIEAISDFAAGSGGKLYMLDAKANVWVYDYENRHREALFRHGHQLFSGQALLAAKSDTIFIADRTGERRIAAYSISNGQLIWAVQEWNEQELHPVHLSVDAKKQVYTVVPLDISVGMNGNPEVPRGGRMAILQWNSAGEVIAVFEDEALRLEEPETLTSLQERYFIAVSPNGKVSLLDAHRKTVLTFRQDGTLGNQFSIAQAGSYAGLSIDANSNMYIGDSGYTDEAGHQERFILKFRGNGEFITRVSGFRGRADKLLHDHRNRMYVFNRETGEISMLDLQARTMILEDTGLPEAYYFSNELDTMEEETQWHKFGLDADIPEETQVRISYFASDYREGFIHGEYIHYSDYMTDPDIPLRDKLMRTRDLWSEPIVNPKDALLMNAKGRYLWFKIEMVGSEHKSPFIRKLRVYFPRVSLISYLPPIYQEDKDNERFLERFLAMFGTFYQEMENKIEGISSYFDPNAVSGEYLKWLGGWLAISEEEAWGETKLRLLIKQAPELYKLRGTRQGLIRMLNIYTGKDPFLIEYFQFKQMHETSELRALFARLYGDNPYCFCVMLPPECVRTDKQRLIIEKIIEDQKPAFTDGKLIVLQAWMYADMHTYLGVNTYLSEPSLLNLDGRSSMPYNTVIIDVDQDRRMDVHTRLGLDSELE
jgi:phage tail-like protein